MNPTQKRQTPPAGGADGAERGNPVGQEIGQYSPNAEKASRGVVAFPDDMADVKAASWGGFKFRWLDQVEADRGVSSAAFRLAYVLASQFLDRRTHEAWPAEATLAERLGVKERQVRNIIGELVAAGHLASRRGGRGRSNRYAAIMFDRQNIADQEGRTNGGLTHLTGNESTFDRQNIAADSRVEPVRGRASSAPLTDSGNDGDLDSRVAALNAASEVPSKVGDVFLFEGREWTVTQPLGFVPARGLSTFCAKDPDGLETDLTIDASGCIDREESPF